MRCQKPHFRGCLHVRGRKITGAVEGSPDEQSETLEERTLSQKPREGKIRHIPAAKQERRTQERCPASGGLLVTS